MRRLVVSAPARPDLVGIARYTEREWGAAQSKRYLGAIRSHLANLLKNPALGTGRNEIKPGYRSLRIGSHLIFYREASGHIEVIRVLHARMDVHRHLEDDPGGEMGR